MATAGFFLTDNDTICYVDDQGQEYLPDPSVDPVDAAGCGIPSVRCDEGIHYYKKDLLQAYTLLVNATAQHMNNAAANAGVEAAEECNASYIPEHISITKEQATEDSTAMTHCSDEYGADEETHTSYYHEEAAEEEALRRAPTDSSASKKRKKKKPSSMTRSQTESNLPKPAKEKADRVKSMGSLSSGKKKKSSSSIKRTKSGSSLQSGGGTVASSESRSRSAKSLMMAVGSHQEGETKMKKRNSSKKTQKSARSGIESHSAANLQSDELAGGISSSSMKRSKSGPILQASGSSSSKPRSRSAKNLMAAVGSLEDAPRSVSRTKSNGEKSRRGARRTISREEPEQPALPRVKRVGSKSSSLADDDEGPPQRRRSRSNSRRSATAEEAQQPSLPKRVSRRNVMAGNDQGHTDEPGVPRRVSRRNLMAGNDQGPSGGGRNRPNSRRNLMAQGAEERPLPTATRSLNSLQPGEEEEVNVGAPRRSNSRRNLTAGQGRVSRSDRIRDRQNMRQNYNAAIDPYGGNKEEIEAAQAARIKELEAELGAAISKKTVEDPLSLDRQGSVDSQNPGFVRQSTAEVGKKAIQGLASAGGSALKAVGAVGKGARKSMSRLSFSGFKSLGSMQDELTKLADDLGGSSSQFDMSHQSNSELEQPPALLDRNTRRRERKSAREATSTAA